MLCFIGGVGLRSFVFVEGFWVFLGLGMLAVGALSFSRDAKVLVSSAMALAGLLGVWWYGAFEPTALALDRFAGQRVAREARIVANPELAAQTQRLIVAFPETLNERVLVVAKRYPEFAYGDTVRVSGAFEKPKNFSNFNYVAYLAKDKIYFTMPFADVELIKAGERSFMRSIFALRRQFEQNVSAALPFPHSAFVNGILLGNDSEMPKSLKDAFVATGVSHVTALSGYNITVIIAFVALILSSFIVSRPVVVVVSVAVIVVFVLMTGASASVVRAGVMGVALLLAQHFGRQRRVINVLVFAAFAMILFNPKILAFDVAFQLSFLALLGLVYIFPRLQERMKPIPEFLKLKESFITTMSAQLAVLPLVLYQFHQFSLVAPIANMLVLPAIPYAMLFGFLTGASGFVSGYLAQLFSYPTWALAAYQLWVVEYFARFSYATLAF